MKCTVPFFDGKSGLYVEKGTEYKDGWPKDNFQSSKTEDAKDKIEELKKAFYQEVKTLLPDVSHQKLKPATAKYFDANPGASAQDFVDQFEV